MQTENRVLADMARLATAAMGTAAGISREARAGVRARLRDAVGGDDAVGRDEFEAVRAMAANARAEVAALRAELAALRGDGAAPVPAAGPAPIV